LLILVMSLVPLPVGQGVMTVRAQMKNRKRPIFLLCTGIFQKKYMLQPIEYPVGCPG